MKYRIGDTVISIDIEEKNMHSNFKPFVCEDDEVPQLTVELVQEAETMTNLQMMVGQIVLMESEDVGVFEGALGIDLVYPKHTQVTSIAIDKGYRSARAFVVQDAQGKWQQELYESLKDVVYLALEQNGRFVLDASSVMVDGRGVVFAADPDAVFAKLCVEKDVGLLINDVTNVVGIYKERIYLYGTPWCNSDSFQAGRTPLGGIVFMKKSDKKEVVGLPEDKRQLLMLVHCKSPLWREGLLDQCLDTIQRVEPSVWIRQLKSQSDAEAVDILRPELAKIEQEESVQY
ncbi:MAG: hypothetical protein J1E62_06080 [Lachnospiraceae bacterium]|nr:hypothetical protein [Lachnospiraceae bacterium]